MGTNASLNAYLTYAGLNSNATFIILLSKKTPKKQKTTKYKKTTSISWDKLKLFILFLGKAVLTFLCEKFNKRQ